MDEETKYQEDASESGGQNSTENAYAEGSDSFSDVAEFLRRGNVPSAEARLDETKERGAEWHYWKGIVHRKKSWFMESRKSFEQAISLDPENEKYQKALNDLNKTASEAAVSENKPEEKKRRLGNFGKGCGAGCAEICCAVSCEACCSIACDR